MNGLIEIGWFNQKTGQLTEFKRFDVGDFDQAAEFAIEVNTIPGQSVYFRPALLKPKCGRYTTDADFLASPGIWCDLDDERAADNAKRIYSALRPKLLPTCIVVTGLNPWPRAQLYWRSEDLITDPEVLHNLNRSIANLLNGDPTVCNPSRLMRVGGSIAWPYKESRVIELTEFRSYKDRPPLPVEALIRGAQKKPGPDAKGGLNLDSRIDADKLIAEIRSGKGKGWHDDVLRLVGHLVSRRFSDNEILAKAETLTLDGYTIEETEHDLSRMINGARKKRWDKSKDNIDISKLDGLVERTTDDPGAPFVPAVLAQLSALKREDRAGFEALRAQLKKTKCRVTELDKAISQEGGNGQRGLTQAELLIALAEEATLFHTPDRGAYADINVNGHRETWPVRKKDFKEWLSRQFYIATDGGAANSEAKQSALDVIEAKARFAAPERTIFTRVGGLDGKLYLDLADERWRAIEISPTGWRIIDNPPVRFRRTGGMMALPDPQPGGSIESLRPFLNIQSTSDFVLIVAWMLAALRDDGPYPVLAVAGEQGSAKSTFSAMLRKLIDPNTTPLRTLPRNDQDLFIAATNGHILVFDNVSGLTPYISDTLSRLATGGGFAKRQLYTDGDEVLFNDDRPILLNGIDDVVTRPDLADRAIFITLPPILEEWRRPEKELLAAFEKERPQILGALLDAVVKGLKMLPQTRLTRHPRMADFALFVTACEPALWDEGTFERAYTANRDEAVDSVIEGDPVASAICSLMTGRAEWEGTVSELMDILSKEVGETVSQSKAWPASPRALSSRLIRAATVLRARGIDTVRIKTGHARTRIIQISVRAAWM